MKDRHAGDAHSCKKDQRGRRMDISFASEDILGFYNKYIAPNIRGQGLDIAIRLLELLDREGNCPSVVPGDDETPERYRTLGNITLAEHSLNVARNAFDMRNNGRRIIGSDTPDILIAALGHDIGKIPALAQKGVPGHTFGTLALLKHILADTGSTEKILEAVRLLHVREKDRKKRKKDLSILQILEQADIQAKDAELKTAGAAAQPNAEPVRLTEDALLCAMKPQLLKDVYESFIFEDKVFLAPAFIKEATIRLAKGDGSQDSLKSCTENHVLKLIGWTGEVPTFMVRFHKRRSRPVIRDYIFLDKKRFGDLPGIEERQKALGVRKATCIGTSKGS